VNGKKTKEIKGKKTHSAGDGLFTPFNLNLLAFVSWFLLQCTGTSGRLP
jgi:hypothetical protein